MNNYIIKENLNEFISELLQNKIHTVIIAETDEKRSVQIDNDNVEVVNVYKLELIAYKQPNIFKCTITNRSLKELSSILEDKGLAVNHTSRNIT